jgi:cytochrome P450
MSLARLEAKITFEKLFARYATLTLAEEEPSWGANDFVRGLETLKVNTPVEDILKSWRIASR